MAARVLALAMMNGSMEEEVMVPFLDWLVEAGYEGVCWHPRDGLLVPYNSRLYWEKLGNLIELAKDRNLDVWHYDEFPFPSGAIGGYVPTHFPASRVRHLAFKEITDKPDRHNLIHLGPGALIALLRYRLDAAGNMVDVRDVTDCTGPHIDTWVWGEWHNLFYTGIHRVREEPHERGVADRFTMVYMPEDEMGDDRLLAVTLETAPGKKSWPGMPDITLPEVTDLFLETVYGHFAEISKEHGIGATPVFQDEVTFYTEMPWNREIEDRLRETWGDGLNLKLAGLYQPKVEGWELARNEYRTACQNAIEANWYARVAAYCREHGLRMTGHLPGEESIIGQTTYMGDAFKNLAHFDIPGYDIISSPTMDDVNRGQETGLKVVQSAAWIAGRKPTFCEVFGAFGFHNDLQGSRTVLAWLAVHGITTIADHSTFTTMFGGRKYDAPPVNNQYTPISVGRADLWQWHNWFADLLAIHEFDPETLVLFPLDAFTRYRPGEVDMWKDETTLVETFYNYVGAHSTDNLFIPTYLVKEVELVEGGFRFRDHIFKKFIVPPVQSLHEDTHSSLERLAGHPGFSWVFPNAEHEITVFGPSVPAGEKRGTKAPVTAHCTEDELVAAKAGWFDDLLDARVKNIHSPLTIIKTLRRSKLNPTQSILVLANPNTVEVEVRSDANFGQPIAQPPNNHTGRVESDGDGFKVTLAPRDVMIFTQDASVSAPAAVKSVELAPKATRIDLGARNHYSLKNGTATLAGYEATPFRPKAVTGLWHVNEAKYVAESEAVFAGHYSVGTLPAPMHFEVEFPITLQESLEDLLVHIDDESLPPNTQVTWDGTPLTPVNQAIYDQHDTVYAIPATGLSSGEHTLRFAADVTDGIHGVTERPILVGRFLIAQDSPLALKAMPAGSQELSPLPDWFELGMPENFGPVTYEVDFEVSAEDAGRTWEIHLPPFIGVAEVEVNGAKAGRSSWEPRIVPLTTALSAGKNTVTVRVFGSWNNLFSTLNREPNGFTGEVTLRASA